jgi:hypothetical protein
VCLFRCSDGNTGGDSSTWKELRVEQFAYLKPEASLLDIEDTDEPFNPAFEVVCEIDNLTA